MKDLGLVELIMILVLIIIPGPGRFDIWTFPWTSPNHLLVTEHWVEAEKSQRIRRDLFKDFAAAATHVVLV